MAKNITPIIGQQYVIITPRRECLAFVVTSISGSLVNIDWLIDTPIEYAPMLTEDDFLNQDGANYHIIELNSPEELLVYQLKYTS